MSEDFLKKIVEHKRKVNEDKKEFFKQIRTTLEKSDYHPYHLFKRIISTPDKTNLIAEIKKASPSKGIIREDFDVVDVAKAYSTNGAAAISVLTEEKFFQGKPEFIKAVSNYCSVPILMKDFVIDAGQIYEARYQGASAILLIAAILDDIKLMNFMEIAESLDIDCLIEVHDKHELKRVINIDAQIIGVNNRDLKTFEVDLGVSEGLLPKIPSHIVKVAESGIKTYDDVKRLKSAGANALLVGETFMSEKDIGHKVKELLGEDSEN